MENEPGRDTSDSEEATGCIQTDHIKAAPRVVQQEQVTTALPDQQVGSRVCAVKMRCPEPVTSYGLRISCLCAVKLDNKETCQANFE